MSQQLLYAMLVQPAGQRARVASTYNITCHRQRKAKRAAVAENARHSVCVILEICYSETTNLLTKLGEASVQHLFLPARKFFLTLRVRPKHTHRAWAAACANSNPNPRYCEQYACAASLGRTRSVKENCATCTPLYTG